MSIDIGLAITTLKEVFGVYETLKSFVYDEMAHFMSQMGEIQYSSAIQSLKDIQNIDKKLSEAEKRQLRDHYTSNAIGALQTARGHFEASAPKGFRGWLQTGPSDRAELYGKICNTLVLQGACFGALGDWANAGIRFRAAIPIFEKYAVAAEESFMVKESRPRYYGTSLGYEPPSHDKVRQERERLDKARKNLKDLEAKTHNR